MTEPSPSAPPVAVLGPGRMGTGIAQVFATAGHAVTVLDTKDRPVGEAEDRFATLRETVRSNLQLLARFDQFDGDLEAVIGRITCTRSVPAAVEGAEWVFEALPEDRSIKRSGLEAIRGSLQGDAVVASTTSSISLETLAEPLPAPGRMLITHWLNPAFIVPLVEVARTDATDEATVRTTVDLLGSVGKEPVVCRDSPGFIGSRVQAAAMNEAVRAYEDDVADLADIDRALRTGVGFRLAVLGLIEFLDIGGVDILYHVNDYLGEALGERFRNPDSVELKIEENDLGAKTGRGYYDCRDLDDEQLAEVYGAMVALRDALYGDDAEPTPGVLTEEASGG